MEPEKLVKVWSGPMLSEIGRLKHLSDSPEVTPEMLREYKVAFKKVWSEIAARARKTGDRRAQKASDRLIKSHQQL